MNCDCFQIVFTKLADTKGSVIDEDDETIHRPDDETVASITEATRAALEMITSSKVS
jgi:hypothetical protein